MKYNKVRMIAKAGNGLRIPKFEYPSRSVPKCNMGGFMNSTPLEFFSLNPNPNNNGSTSPINTNVLLNNTLSNSNQMLNTFNKSGLRQRVKEFLSNNKQQFMNIGNVGLDLLGSSFNNVENSSGIDTAFLVGDTATNILGTVNPVLGLAGKGVMTALKGINSLGGKRADSFSIDLNTIENVGGSYGGSVNDINSAAAKAGKKYGLFSSRKRRRANREIREARRLQNIMTNIADEAADLLGMINDINYLRYNSNINGGYDLANIRAAKSGMKILDKINLIKKRNLHSSYINVDTKSIEEFKEGGSILPEWMPVIEDIWEPIIEEFKEGGSLQSEWKPVIELLKEEKLSFEDWYNSIPKDYRASGYDYKKAYEVLDWETLYNHTKDPNEYHLKSVSPVADENGNYPFLKLGKIENNPEIQGEFNWYNSEEGKEHKSKFDIKYINDRYYYIPKKFKNGGKTKEGTLEIEETTQKNVIPEGALHKNKHHMEHTEGLTQKGIPVVDNEGNLQAEIELNEWTMTLELTKTIEELYKQFYSEEVSLKEKDDLAISAGRILVEQILHNTDDRTNLIETIKI